MNTAHPSLYPDNDELELGPILLTAHQSLRGGRHSKWKIFTGVIHFLSQSDFTKKSVCEIDRYPHMPILHLDYGAKKLLFLVHKNNCIFIGKKLIEVKLRELNKHIIRCLKHHIGNLTFFIRQVIPFLSPSLFQKYKMKKEQHFRQRVWLQADELWNANDGYKINS